MEGSSHPLDAGHPQDVASPRRGLYPDPEVNSLTSLAWPASSLSYGVDSLMATPFQPHIHETFSLQDSKAEFESASAQRRSESRGQSDESDFLEELSENE
jgi:general transcription factor 3C polypeptide 3 (transcription factor C subunit 4)